jgi:hypothetical protein
MGIVAGWIQLPVWQLLAVLVAFYVAFGIAIHWLSFYSPASRWTLSFNGVVGPFFVSAVLIFGLLHSFIAREIWQRNDEAAQVVRAEGDALRALSHLVPESDPAAARIQDLIRAYAKSVIAVEWPQMRQGKGGVGSETEFARLLSAVVDTPVSRSNTPAVQRARIDLVLKLHTLRGTRLAIAGDTTDEIKWATLLILGVVAQVAIAAVHLETPRPQIAALVIFTMAAIIALGFVAIQERPFAPPLAVSPEPLEEVVHEIHAG